MTTQKINFMLLALSMILVPARAEEQISPEPSNTRYATARLRISTDPAVLPMGDDEGDTNRLDDIFRLNPHVLHKTLTEVFGDVEIPDRYSLRDKFFLRILENPKNVGGLQTICIRPGIHLNEPLPPRAKEFVQMYIDHLRAELEKQFDAQMQLFNPRHRTYAVAINTAEAELRQLQNQQNAISSEMPMDKESVRHLRMEHRQALIDNQMQKSVLKQRVEVISHQIAEIKSDLQHQMKADTLLDELEQMLTQQKNELDRIEKEQQANPMHMIVGISELREKMLLSRMRLAEHRRQIEQEAGGDRLRELNQQLQEAAIRLQELEILEIILYGTDPGSLSKSSEYEILEVRINAARENLHNAIIEKNGFERQMNLIQPPKATVESITCSEKAG